MKNQIKIRPVAPGDLTELAALCKEHAEYEHAQFIDNGQIARWETAFFAERPVLFGWVAEAENQLCGFMTVTVDYATWDAAYFAHMDCMYLKAAYRGQGLGRRFFAELSAFCVARGYGLAQWQTPPHNELGIGFYRRMGAAEKHKLRFFLEVPA